MEDEWLVILVTKLIAEGTLLLSSYPDTCGQMQINMTAVPGFAGHQQLEPGIVQCLVSCL